jgi:hypothetical protein
MKKDLENKIEKDYNKYKLILEMEDKAKLILSIKNPFKEGDEEFIRQSNNLLRILRKYYKRQLHKTDMNKISKMNQILEKIKQRCKQ